MNKLITEGIGTFFLVLTIGLAISSGTPFAPLVIGTGLMGMIYMGGHISGAHYNPATTLGFLMNGKIGSGEALKYVGTQLIGAVLAGIASSYLTGNTLTIAPEADAARALFAEILFTFALVLVILQVAINDATKGNAYYGLAIGVIVMAGVWAVGDISGGVFNPAVGLGAILVDAVLGDGGFGNLWLYIVGPLVGGALAAIVFKLQVS